MNEGIDYFMGTEADLLLILDADIQIPPRGIVSLLMQDVDIASGLYPNKKKPQKAVAGYFVGKKEVFYDMIDVRGRILGANERVFAGSGFMLIKRRVFKKYFKRIPPLRFRWRKDQGEPGSDILFHREAQELGFNVRLHGGVVCGHLPLSPLDKLDEYLNAKPLTPKNNIDK